MTGPDRIWAKSWKHATHSQIGVWSATQQTSTTEYVRRAPAVLAALPEVQSLIAGALQSIADKARTELAAAWAADLIAQWVRNATPADAIAARDAMIADAETRALDAIGFLSLIADIRAATVGSKPMLSDLAQALVSWRDEAVSKEREDCARMVDCGCEKGQKAAVIGAKNGADRARACGQYNCGAEDAAAIRKRGEGQP